MKHLIITLLLAFTVLAVSAQNKTTEPPKPPKPVFQLNQQKDISVDIKLHFKAYQLSDYFFVEQNGIDALISSQKISSGKVKDLLLNHQSVIDSLNNHVLNRWIAFYQGEQKVFNDTVGKVKKPENIKKQ